MNTHTILSLCIVYLPDFLIVYHLVIMIHPSLLTPYIVLKHAHTIHMLRC